jgi:hypothetical protein
MKNHFLGEFYNRICIFQAVKESLHHVSKNIKWNKKMQRMIEEHIEHVHLPTR